MRMYWIPALVAAVGCASVLDRRHDYDTMLGELHRDVRPEADIALGDHLDRDALVRAVLARNPSVAAMRQAWRAATADVRRAGALDDPMVTYEIAPLSIAGTSAPFGQRVQVSQKVPWPGKRGLEADVALADAEIAREELRATTLELAELASNLYDDYVLVGQELALNDHHRMLAEQMMKATQAQLAAGRGSLQDTFAAELEIGKLAQDRLGLENARDATIAQLDGLLHRAPDAPLPPPVVETAITTDPAALDALLRMAAERPDARAASKRVTSDVARVDAADRTFYPDFELMASYDSMWDMPEHRWMVGVGVEVPLQRGKREAAADAARARVAAVSSQLDRLRDDIRVAVFRARRDVVESIALIITYDQQLLPVSRAQVDAALQGFATGRNDFSTVIAAEHGIRDLEVSAARARAQLAKRRSALDKATGRLPGGGMP